MSQQKLEDTARKSEADDACTTINVRIEIEQMKGMLNYSYSRD
jgi:hypothetical protein